MQVMVRVRPTNQREIELAGDACSLQERGSSSLHLRVGERTYDFKFDELLGSDGSQEELFQRTEFSSFALVKQHYVQLASVVRDATSIVGAENSTCACSGWGPHGEQRHARIQCVLLCIWTNWRRENSYDARRTPSGQCCTQPLAWFGSPCFPTNIPGVVHQACAAYG